MQYLKGQQLKAIAVTLIAILTLCYPLLVYWGLNNFDISILAIAGIFLVVTQLILRSIQTKNNFKIFLPLTIGLVTTYFMAYFLKNSLYMKFTPVLINLNFFILFAMSIFNPPTMIERFARIRFKDLPPEAIPYCRKVTFIWMAFFVVNGSIALWTVSQDFRVWTLYNGIIAYILMGILFGAEFIYREFFMKKKSNATQLL